MEAEIPQLRSKNSRMNLWASSSSGTLTYFYN
jgi:hypothetical protein